MAFFELLKDNDFNKITITEIINKSGVSRMGFYRNYSSKEEIIEKFIEECFDETVESIKKERDLDFSIVTIMKSTLTYFQQYSKYMKIIIDRDQLYLLFKAYEKAFRNLYETTKESRLRDYSTQMFIGELFLLEMQWVKTGMHESPSEMANIYYKILKLRVGSLDRVLKKTKLNA